LEHIEYVVDIEFGQAVGQNGAHEVRVAVEIVIGAADYIGDVRVTSCAKEVVAATVPLCDTSSLVS
jgi:hypothetical protein